MREKWNAANDVVEAEVKLVNGALVAEADLAVSFAPGDNFVVAARLTREPLASISDMPVIQHPSISPQLSVWRHLFLETDRMQPVETADKITTSILEIGPAPRSLTDPTPIPGVTNLKLSAFAMVDDEYKGGILRFHEKNYFIIGNNSDSLNIIGGNEEDLNPSNLSGDAEVFQDDYAVDAEQWGGNALTVSPGSTDVLDDTITVVTDRSMPENYFAGGVAVLKITLFGQLPAPWTYDIVSNTSAGTLTLRKKVEDGPVPNGAGVRSKPDVLALFRVIGTEVPHVRVDPSSEADMYKLLQPTTERAKNRLADAYVQPDYIALSDFSTTLTDEDSFVLAMNHARPLDSFEFNAARFTEEEFWVAYLSSAYEGPLNDGDPDSQGFLLGGTEPESVNGSFVYFETARDYFQSSPDPSQNSVLDVIAEVAAHELVHQLLKGDVGTVANGNHRDDPPNIISGGTVVADEQLYLFNADIVTIRRRLYITRAP